MKRFEIIQMYFIAQALPLKKALFEVEIKNYDCNKCSSIYNTPG